MSRSYKKTPIVKDGHSGKFGKKVANRKVRHHKGELANGKAYRKLYNSWDIHDYVSYYPYEKRCKDEEAEIKSNLNDGIPAYLKGRRTTLSRHQWEKFYKRK